MKRLFLLLAVLAACSACSVTYRVPVRESSSPWVGSTTVEILDAMGDPARIDGDGRGGSILIYESTPDYNDPAYDILDPDASVKNRRYAYFYLDDEGTCYQVDTNRSLPAPPRRQLSLDGNSVLFDILFYAPLLLLLIAI